MPRQPRVEFRGAAHHVMSRWNREAVTAVTTFARPYDISCGLSVVPEISNDGQNWEARTGDPFGSLYLPQTQLQKMEEIGAFLRYDIRLQAEEEGAATAGFNPLIVTMMRARDPDVPSPSFEELAAYLDAMRRGLPADPPSGAGRHLPFWPLGTALAGDDGTGTTRTIHTQALATPDGTEVVAGLDARSFQGNANFSFMRVYPQISNDGTNWATLTGKGFTELNTASSFPFLEHVKIETVGSHMRFAVQFVDYSGLGASFAATFEISGVVRN